MACCHKQYKVLEDKTRVGHGTDIAILLGLSGDDPVTCDVNQITPKVEHIKAAHELVLAGKHAIPFYFKEDLLFLFQESLPFHPNAVTFRACFKDETRLSYFGVLPERIEARTTNAAKLNKKLINARSYVDFESCWVQAIDEGGKDFDYILDWCSCLLFAVNEEMLHLDVVVYGTYKRSCGGDSGGP
ncbi:hypothetical protein FQR65_LT16649 [Abscondita terminalis]|nr:hypothetical protein FQR65_LT16649 [Abscondita terminalis]